MFHEKDKIVYHTWKFLETEDIYHANKAQEWLSNLAKRYHFSAKKKEGIKKDLKVAFEEFLLGNKPCSGQNGTINTLYNSL